MTAALTTLVAAREAAAEHYFSAATAEMACPDGSLTVASHLRATGARILSGSGDHHPMVQAHLQSLSQPSEAIAARHLGGASSHGRASSLSGEGA